MSTTVCFMILLACGVACGFLTMIVPTRDANRTYWCMWGFFFFAIVTVILG